APWAYRVPLVRSAAYRVTPNLNWLCPAESDLGAMLAVARAARREAAAHLEFMLHSSQFIPGGSPTYRSASQIDRLYEHLEILFEHLSSWCYGTTLQEFDTLFSRVSDRQTVSA